MATRLEPDTGRSEKMTSHNSYPSVGEIVSITYTKSKKRHRIGGGALPSDLSSIEGIVLEYNDYASLPSAKRFEPDIVVMGINGKRHRIAVGSITSFSHDTSIPEAGRKVMSEYCDWTANIESRWKQRIAELERQMEEDARAHHAADIEAALSSALGMLSPSEFSELVREKIDGYLPVNIYDAMWRCSLSYGKLRLFRTIPIATHYTGPLSHLDFDDGRYMVDDAEHTDEGQSYMRRYRKPLDVSCEMTEGLCLEGSDNTLCYWAEYEIAEIEDGTLLTEELADNLARAFTANQLD